MECREVDRFAELSFDGELDAVDRAELERHLQQCSACRHRVHNLGWLRSQIRARLQNSEDRTTPPLGLRTRVASRIRAEEHRRRSVFARFVPVTLAIAALATLSWSTTANTTTLDPEASVQRHAAHLPPEVRALGDAGDVLRFLRANFGHTVTIPDTANELPHLRLIGARLDHVSNRRAAFLMYDHRGARISVLVYPSDREKLAPPPRFESRTIGGSSVLMGQHRGYNVMAWVRGPLVYSLVSDIDPHELVRLVRAF